MNITMDTSCKNIEEYTPCPYITCEQHMVHTWRIGKGRGRLTKKIDCLDADKLLSLLPNMPETCFKIIMQDAPYNVNDIGLYFNLSRNSISAILNKYKRRE